MPATNSSSLVFKPTNPSSFEKLASPQKWIISQLQESTEYCQWRNPWVTRNRGPIKEHTALPKLLSWGPFREKPIQSYSCSTVFVSFLCIGSGQTVTMMTIVRFILRRRLRFSLYSLCCPQYKTAHKTNVPVGFLITVHTSVQCEYTNRGL